jgi:hypothetical protein
VRRGSVGKGAASVGVDLVLHIAEQVLNDGASVFAWGTVLWALNKKCSVIVAARSRFRTRSRSRHWPRLPAPRMSSG